MTEKIAVIDFPSEGNSKSWFVGNGAEGQGGLVARIEENGFGADLIDFRTLPPNSMNPGDYAAVFFASGWTHIKDPGARKKDPNTREINSELESTCRLYDSCINQDVPVVAFTHGSQILGFHTGGDYFELDEGRTRMEPFGGYVPADENALKHWLLEGISEQNLQAKNFSREFRKYGFELTNSPFTALVNPDLGSAGPAIAVHEDPTKIAVLFMMHPEYNKDLPGYRLMENVFAKLKQ